MGKATILVPREFQDQCLFFFFHRLISQSSVRFREKLQRKYREFSQTYSPSPPALPLALAFMGYIC